MLYPLNIILSLFLNWSRVTEWFQKI